MVHYTLNVKVRLAKKIAAALYSWQIQSQIAHFSEDTHSLDSAECPLCHVFGKACRASPKQPSGCPYDNFLNSDHYFGCLSFYGTFFGENPSTSKEACLDAYERYCMAYFIRLGKGS
jgi:hypothetical protein